MPCPDVFATSTQGIVPVRRARTVIAVVVCCVVTIGAMLPIAVRADDAGRPEITARHAIVVDAASGAILFARDADTRVAPASLTKLITAAVAIEMAPLDTAMTVREADLIGEASMGLRVGEILSLDALLHGMLMASGNDAASVVARESAALPDDAGWQATQRFLDRANAFVADVGMYDTHLANPHGLDAVNHYSTARDLATLTLHLWRNAPQVLAIAGTATWRGEGHALTNTNALLGSYPGLIAGKTGYTRDAGYCLVEVAQRGDRTVIVVLLGSTSAAWYTDAASLLEFGFAAQVGGVTPASLGRISPGMSTAPAEVPPPSAATTTTRLDAEVSIVHATPLATPTTWRLVVVALVGVACVAGGAACAGEISALYRPRGIRRADRSVKHLPDWDARPFIVTQSGWTEALPKPPPTRSRPAGYGDGLAWRSSSGD